MTHRVHRLVLTAFAALGALCAFGVSAPAARAQQLPARQGEDDPRGRSDYFEQQRAYPFQRIPAGARFKALQSMRLLNLIAPASALASPMTAWQSLGPTPIQGNNSGRVAAIAVHPTNAQIVYVGGAQGGVWKTTDGGTTWTPLGDAQCSLAIGSITIDPVNPNIVYVGTGEENFSGDSYYGCGVLRTTDGGATWSTLGQNVFQTATGGARIAKILVDPATAGTTAATLYAATSFGLYKSINGGTTWANILNKGYSYVTDVVMPGTSGNPIFAAAASPYTNVANGLYLSLDNGASWTLVGGGLPTSNVGRIAITVSPANPSVMWVSVENPATSNLTGLYRTNDGGNTWLAKSANGVNCSAQCWYAMVLTASPTDTSTVYFSGLSLYRSLDRGTTFTDVALPIHVDHHALVFDPQTPTTMYAGTDGGIYRSLNIGASWTSLNASLSLTQFYGGLSLHPTSGAVLGGTQDNGSVEYTGSSTWSAVLGGDGGFTAINPANPSVSYAETQWSANSGYSGPRRRTSPLGGFSLVTNGIGIGDAAQFIPPIALDPAHPSFLYFGTSKLYRTRNGGDLWTSFGSGMFPRGGTVTAIGVAQSDTNVVYVGASTGDLALTTDGGATWRTISGGLPARNITSIIVNRANPAIAYVTVSGFGAGHVWRTANSGTTWSDISANLPNIPVNGFALIPGGELVIGSDLGVFRSTDDGASWSLASTGLPNVAVFDVKYNLATSTLAAATHGRGVWTAALTPTLVPTQVILESAPVAYLSGAAMGTFSVSLREVTGTTVPGANNAVTVAVTAGGGTLTGAKTVNAAAGVATFIGLQLAGSGTQTLTFTAAGMTPLSMSVRMIIPVTFALSATSRRDTVTVGTTPPRADSVDVAMSGDSAAVATWTATKGHAWTTLVTAAGVGPGRLRWTRNATGLVVGRYVDTITVTSPSVGAPVRVIDTLVVRASVAVVAFAGDTIRGAQNDLASIDLQADLRALPGSALGAYAATVAWDSSVVRLDSVRAIATGFAAPAVTAVGIGKVQLSASALPGAAGVVPLARLFYRFVGDTSGKKSALVTGVTTFTSTTTGSLLGALSVVNGGAVAVGVLRGDVNGDGQITAVDVQLILQAAAGLPLTLPAKALPNGDADCDGKITARDAQIVLAKLLGLPVSQFCVGKIR